MNASAKLVASCAAVLAISFAIEVGRVDGARAGDPATVAGSPCTGVRVEVAGAGKTCLDPSRPDSRDFRDCFKTGSGRACGPEMTVLPPGSFLMGSPKSEAGHSPEELARDGKQLSVTFEASFAIGKYEVTFADWDACSACDRNLDDGGWGRGRQPVINVTWDDAQIYVGWLSSQTGKRYRLPTEAEWEYAARAGSSTAFATGPGITADGANIRGDLPYPGSPRSMRRRRPLEVGSFAPNSFGLHDFHGNVWEWVADCWQSKLSLAAAPTSERGRPCRARSIRGGSWMFDPFYARSASRNRYRHDFKSSSGGFRVVRDIGQ